MDEKIIVKSERSFINILVFILGAIGLGFFIYGFVFIFDVMGYDIINDGLYLPIVENMDFAWTIFVGLFFIVVTLIVMWAMYTCELTVTNKRVYGKSAFGHRVDLPLDKISSVASGWMGSIAVATSSGKIKFWSLKNRKDIFSTVSNLLIERQNTKTENSPSTDAAEELKKFKDLLDTGAITQEEFDVKKKQLLNL